MGTFDISILNLGDGVFEVKSTNGNTHLGGDDFDQKIINWLAEEYKAEKSIDLRKDPIALQRLKEAAEKAKCELSSSAQTEINLPYITVLDGVPQHLVKTLSRAKFEQLCDDLIQATLEPCRQAMKDAGMTNSDIDEVILVGGSTRIPAVQNAVEKFFGKKPSKNVNPDEVVAVGAAIQGGVLSGDVKDVLLLDVTPLNLGMETLGGVMTTMIEANTTIPFKYTQTFTTATDNQTAVTIHVLQGCRPMAKDNRSLGMFNLEGIMPAKRGVPKLEVTFDIDASGILSVSAKDLATNKEQSIRIEAGSKLSDEEIAKMKADAEAHADEDKKAEEVMEKANKCESLIYTIEQMIDSLKDNPNLSEDDKTYFNEHIDKLKTMKESKDFTEFENVEKDVQTRMFDISTKVYGQGQPGSAGNPFKFDPSNMNFDGFTNAEEQK